MRSEEGALRDALHARAAAVPVGRADETGLGRRLGAARRKRQQSRLAAAAALLVVVVGGTSLLAATGDEQNVLTGPDTPPTIETLDPSTTTVETTTVETTTVETTTTLAAPSTTTAAPDPTVAPTPGPTAAPRTTSTTTPLPPVPDDAVWPPPGSATTFSTADAAAGDFARRFLGMATPRLGPAQVSGDGARVAVRPFATGGPTTVVALRRIDRRGWVVVDSRAENIQVDQPTAGSVVASPLAVRGRALAYEGTVNVEVRRDGANAPIGESFGTGGGTEMLPFEATVTFARPPVGRGTLVVFEGRADDGALGPAAATVVRVRF